MWSKFVLCLLVGLTAASDYGWKSNTEYLYKVRGRTLAGLHDVADQYSGVIVKANLFIRPQESGKLMGRISDAQYAQVHTVLPEGWESEIPESKLHYKQLPISEKTFEVILKDGIVRDIIVSKDCTTAEANLLKAIVSQIQLNTQGKHIVKSHVTQLPEDDSNSAVFKTMEETVTGKYETLYDISPLPEYVLQSQPWLAPLPKMKGDGEFIEIVKSKNFSRGDERVGYHYGLGFNKEWEPNTNHLGDFFLRSSVSRVIISGNLKRYTIQSSSTSNKIVLSPTLNSEQKGMVVSFLNLTLSHVQPASSQFAEVQQPKSLGSLVYSYNNIYESKYEEKHRKQYRSGEDYDFSGEEINRARRYQRSVSSEESAEDEQSYTQDLPKMHEAPQTPLLPMSIGYKGKSIKTADSVDFVKAAEKLAEQIGHELHSPERVPKEKTLSKFVLLTRLTRYMSESELQKIASALYNKEKHGAKAVAWESFRDAVAESGTAPALLLIKQWISEKKVYGEEAAELVATLAQSTLYPTNEYMRTFYSMVKKDEVRSQAILNDTAIIAFSSLVRKVYIDNDYFHNQYPVHSFDKFYKSSEAEQFVRQEFIPYLKEKLEQAIEKGDSHKVLVYIRALGYCADKKILAVFEPYLEGEKQVSQFQRLQMVLALNKLAQVHTKTALSVLYKIYQNAGEMQVIRCAAVYQIMRTNPPASVLQRMAQYTNVDVHEQVNSAVKSAIESAAELQGEEYAELAEKARSALPLLTKQTYGVQDSRHYIRNYVVDEMNAAYRQRIESYGSEDSLVPKGLKYRLVGSFGGVNTELISVEAMISSIDELTNVLAQQTEIYQQKMKQQKQNYQQAMENKWSSESVARKLKIETDEREQLESILSFQIGGASSRFFTINNRTIELLPEVIREIEEALRDGQDVHYTKLINRDEIVLSFPTETSFPFYFTFDAPTVFRIDGQIRATAEPQVSSGHALHKPHTITAESKIEAFVSTKIQARIGFVTPFDHQKYTAGYEKNIQVHVPFKSHMKVDLKNKQVRFEIEPKDSGKNVEVFHYSSYPYTSIKDLLKLDVTDEQVHSIKSVPSERATHFQTVVGKKSGMAFRVNYESEQQVMDSQWLWEQIQRQDGVSGLMAPFWDETIMRSYVSVQYAADLSSVSKINIRAGYEHRYESEESNDSESHADISELSGLPDESKSRQQKLSKMVSSGISSADIYVADASIEFEGERKVEYQATAGLARSSVDDKSRMLFIFKKSCDSEKPYEIAFSAKAHIPNTNGLDYTYALKFDPTSTIKCELAFGENYKSSTKVNMEAKLRQSESRRQYLKSLPRAQECHREMQEGNKQLSACANMTAEANLMDRINLKFHFENITPKMANVSYKVYDLVRYFAYYNIEENMKFEKSGMPKSVEFEARFEPNFEYVNVSMTSDKIETDLKNIRVHNIVKQIVAVHPVFPVHTRVMSELFNYDAYRPICVADKTQVNTFDNTTYEYSLGHAWHVLAQYVPDFAWVKSHEQSYVKQQEEQQLEQYLVLLRDSKDRQQKEMRITIRTPETQGKVIQIDVTPAGSSSQDYSGSKPCAKVQINDKDYKYNDQTSTDFEDGLIQVYALPNGEVKIEIRDAFYVIYDTERVKISAMHQKLLDSLRGLCGTYSGYEYDDFMTPKNCILRDAREFASTWALEETEQVQKYQSRAERSECTPNEVTYANVISDYDTGRREQHHKQSYSNSHTSHQSESCTMHQTRYVMEDDDSTVCFTIRPVPVCKSSCVAGNTIRKSVAVHCVQKTNVADMWIKQIQRGSSPDFSSKSATKTVKIDVPEVCTKY